MRPKGFERRNRYNIAMFHRGFQKHGFGMHVENDKRLLAVSILHFVVSVLAWFLVDVPSCVVLTLSFSATADSSHKHVSFEPQAQCTFFEAAGGSET